MKFVEFYGTDPQGYGYEVVSVEGDDVIAQPGPHHFHISEFTSGYLVPPCSCGSTRLCRTVNPEAGINETYCEECGDVQS